MLSKNKIRFIISLQKKKARDEEKLYVIEGDKLIKEYLMSGIRINTLIAKPEFIGSLPADQADNIDETESVSFEDLKKVSTLKTPHNAIALVPVPESEFEPENIFKDLCAALDFIQDPGNLGTIIRSAAWFGIRNIVCSEDSVDQYNPKVIQASMGALLHVKVHYHNLRQFLAAAQKQGLPVYGAMVEGESVYNHKPGNNGIILLGNESRGISDELMPFVSKKIMIPRFNNYKYGIDSLNVSMAASIIFSEFARKKG
jgi:TrmH family RNA methyltransferase